jgi:hypothetical protein
MLRSMIRWGHIWKVQKGVKPGLFNMAADVLTKMVMKAQSNGLVVGMASYLIDNRIAILR